MGVFTASIILFLCAGPGWAGSFWRTLTPENSAGASGRETFTLRGSYLSPSTVRPNITLVCEHGKLVSSSFNTFVAAGDEKLGVVLVTGASKEEYKQWKAWEESKSFRPHSRFLKDLLVPDRVDVVFSTNRATEMTAEFEPSAAYASRIRKACGIR